MELDMTVMYARRCPAVQTNGRACMQPAGSRTKHKGWGFCRFHQGGVRPVEETWAMAAELAEQLDMNPLEALLHSVRVAGAHAAWADVQLQAAIKRQEDDGGNPGDAPNDAVKRWMIESRNERRLFVQASKLSVDAGVAAALVQRVELESTAVAEAVMAAVDTLDLEPSERNRALGKAQERLLEIAGAAMELPDVQGLSDR
jgi:hypothetical protein